MDPRILALEQRLRDEFQEHLSVRRKTRYRAILRRQLSGTAPEFSVGALGVNAPLNATAMLPLNANRVVVPDAVAVHGFTSDYVNASLMPMSSAEAFCESAPPLSRGAIDATPYIAAARPQRRYEARFWTAMLSHHVTRIVMLCSQDELDTHYFPRQPEGSLEFREGTTDVVVTCLKWHPLPGDIDVRTLRVEVFVDGGGGGERAKPLYESVVVHYAAQRWTDREAVAPTPTLDTLVNVLLTRSPWQRVCVHCLAGIGRTGSLLAAAQLATQLGYQQSPRRIDFQSIVQDVRRARPSAVPHVVQYIMLLYYAQYLRTRYERLPADAIFGNDTPVHT